LIAPVNTLVLGGEDLIDDAKLAHIIEKNEIEQHESATGAQRWVATLPLAGRDLTGANLDGADVRHVDFTSAILNRANLDFAWANEARFDYAQLRGALLIFSQLRGALLVSAQLQAASLYNAQLQGAFLDSAQLQNASLNYAQLQGASLVSAKLQGASLDEAQLQGASLGGAQLRALHSGMCLFGALTLERRFGRTPVAGPNISPKRRCYEPGPPPPGYDKDDVCDWTVDTFEALKRLIGEQVPEGYTRRKAMERIEQNLDPTKALEGGVEMTQVWADHEHYSPALDVYEKNLAEQWRETGCAADGAPYVLRGLLHLLDDPSASPFASDSPEKSKLAAAFLDKDCAGARGLSEASITKLKEIAAPAAPQAPKP
jgi:uncharacterized protein YjbI with pentapeptide repeats